MPFAADLHVHSHYSISTSPELDPEHLAHWAAVKGIAVVGTGDFTHPGWRKELREKLLPAEDGLFALRPGVALPGDPPAGSVRFILSAEISGIYRRDGKVRKVHNVVLAPDLETVERISARLERIGNLSADGRPILALDSRDLLAIVLESSPDALLIPAHIWTPWFSTLGSKSGFDSVEECFGDLSPHIGAVETGLSSDPPMNFMVSALDRYTLVSNSDAHSPERLGREANLLETELSYAGITRALREGEAAGFRGTIEFFPEEGKYHLDGHRKCGIRQHPELTRESGGRCPVCGKELTIGVLYRVLELADRSDPTRPRGAPPHHSLIPLREVLAEIADRGAQSKGVTRAYESTIASCGTELEVLMRMDVSEIERQGGELLGEAIARMRRREVFAEPGYDGEYGVVRLFRPGEIGERKQRFLLSGMERSVAPAPAGPRRPIVRSQESQPELFDPEPGPDAGISLTEEQLEAAMHGEGSGLEGPALVIAGPGTGKTRTLTARVARLLTRVRPESILVVTFTNKAAFEIRERLASSLGAERSRRIRAGTFHSFGLSLLGEHAGRFGRSAGFTLCDERDREQILLRLAGGRKAARNAAQEIARLKQGAYGPEPETEALIAEYERELRERDSFDLDDLVLKATEIVPSIPHGVEWLLVDELQDLNAAQYRLIRALMPSRDANLFAIGDPDQAIYGFRGGDAAIVERLLADYPAARTYVLTKSHRCPRSVLRASAHILARAGGRPLEGLEDGVKVRVIAASSERSEAELIAREVESMMGGLRFFSMDSDIASGHAAPEIGGLGDFAVLVRSSAQADPIQAAFDDHAIPYQRLHERSYREVEPCRSILELLSFSARPEDTVFRRKIRGRARALGRSDDLEASLRPLEDATALAGKIRAASRWLGINDRAELRDVERLLESAAGFGDDVFGFLRLARLGSPGDDYVATAERVAIMTLHAAKGLEFRCVFIAGCEDGIIPFTMAPGSGADLAEERRLLYVGATRASRLLVLTHARRRRLYGRSVALPRSRFLADLDEESFEVQEQPVPRRTRRDAQLDLGLGGRRESRAGN